jgi:hypothetical protein
VMGCLILTAIVMHTALRIEHLNSRSGMFLPRTESFTTEWRVPELKHVLGYVDTQIATRRSNAYSVQNPEKELPATEMFVGAPYSQAEQNWIDRSKDEHDAHTRLHWWVTSFGAAQYLMAPIAFVWAMANALAIRKTPHRVVSCLCAMLAFGAIFLMFFRGY